MSKMTPGELAADIVARIDAASSLVDVTNIMASEAAKGGLQGILLFDRDQWSVGGNSGFVIAREADFMTRYGAQPEFGLDPVLLRAIRSPAAFRFSVIEDYKDVELPSLKKAARGMRENEIVEGWITPLHGTSGFLGVMAFVGGRDVPPVEASIQKRLNLFSIEAFRRVRELSAMLAPIDTPALEARELALLQWLADGTQVRDIGWYMGATDGEVSRLIVTCMEKLGARTPTQAVAAAIRLRVLA